MTTTFFLIRHATYGLMEKTLVGRTPHLSLDAQGVAQAERLAARFAATSLAAVQTSPRERAVETAGPIAVAAGCPVENAPALDEIDVGEWTGRSFTELARDPRWHAWNATRSRERAPGGESMVEVQARVVAHLERMRSVHPGARVALVSHADVIKAAIMHYLGLSLDRIDRIEIGPAAVSTLAVGAWGGKLIALNEAAS